MNPSTGNLARRETSISVMLQDNYMLFQKNWLLIYQSTSKFLLSLPKMLNELHACTNENC